MEIFRIPNNIRVVCGIKNRGATTMQASPPKGGGMGKKTALLWLQALHAKQITSGFRRLGCSCLFAPFKHKGGTDSHPSAGVRLGEGPGRYHCYTCKSFGTLSEVAVELHYLDPTGRLGQVDWQYVHSLAEGDEEVVPDFGDPDAFDGETPQQSFHEYPEEWLDSFIHLGMVPVDHPAWLYFLARGGADAVAVALDIRVDTARRRICFPVRDGYGRLAGMQGRDYTGGSQLRYFDYPYEGKSNRCAWLGEDTVDFDLPVVATEGPFDYMAIKSVYRNTLASMSSSISPERMGKLRDAVSVVTFYDYGLGGDNARSAIHTGLSGHPIMSHIIPPEKYGDAGAMPLEGIRLALQEAGII